MFTEDPGRSAKSAGGSLHLNIHTPLTQRSRSGLTMPLSRYSVGTYQQTSSRSSSGNTRTQSSQLAELLWTDPSVKSGISVRELKRRKKEEKKRRRQNQKVEHSPKVLASEEKANTTRFCRVHWTVLDDQACYTAFCLVYFLVTKLVTQYYVWSISC